MSDKQVCPCEQPSAELTVRNGPGLDHIGYRVGDFLSIRRALLNALADEAALRGWRPDAKTDLAVQMVEWWAYLGDILTFYNERIANQAYLRTADLPESLRRLVRLLGYRPRPGIAARGFVAALVSGHGDVTLPRGFAIDSKPGPNQTPQTFELDSDTVVKANDSVPARPPEFLLAPTGGQFLLKGANTSVQANSPLMLASRDPVGHPLVPRLLKVSAVQLETTPAKTKQTRVSFSALGAGSLPVSTPAKHLRVRRAGQTVGVWTLTHPVHAFFHAKAASKTISGGGAALGIAILSGFAIDGTTVHLAGVARDIHPGDWVLFTRSGPVEPQLRQVNATQDAVWFANPDNPNFPWVGPDPKEKPPIPVLHTQLTLGSALDASWTAAAASVSMHYGWQDIGPLQDQPATGFNGSPADLLAVEPALFRSGAGAGILLEDALGLGMKGFGSATEEGARLTVSGLPAPPLTLAPPLTVYYNLLPVSRGKTVAREVLGSGNASLPGQAFVLKKAPLTYLAQGDSYASTLEIRVNGRLWKEAKSFYGQTPQAEIFVIAEDEDQKTHVKFGDGVNGTRLPTGVDNVVATYRYGSGAEAPGTGQLSVVAKPFPNLKAVRNPVPVGGGADPDPAGQIRRYAPRSALTLGRAVSADDYEAIAAGAPGVARARSYWSFSGEEQRGVVRIYVGDDLAAVDSARSALMATGDPNRRVDVAAAAAVPVWLFLEVLVDPLYRPEDVKAQVAAALLDDTRGVFGSGRLRIGQAVFDSQIAEACLRVEGASALRSSFFFTASRRDFRFRLAPPVEILPGQFGLLPPRGYRAEPGPRHVPGEGDYFQLKPEFLWIFTEVAAHAG